MKNGLPIGNTASGYQGGKGKDMWGTFADRDPRLYQNIQPPYVVAPHKGAVDNVNTFKSWKFLKAGDNNQGPRSLQLMRLPSIVTTSTIWVLTRSACVVVLTAVRA